MKRLKVFVRCQSLFQLSPWFFFLPSAVSSFSLFTANSLPLLQLPSSSIVLILSHYQSLPLSTSFTLGTNFSMLFLHLMDPICTHLINQMMCFFCCSLPTHLFPFICPWCAYSVSHIHVMYYVQHLHNRTHPRSHTDQPQCNAYHGCSSFLFGPKKRSHKLIYHNTFSHTYTHKTLNKNAL